MKKPKKGKFRYNLASVLKVRTVREKKEREKFAETQKILEQEKKKEEELKASHLQAQLDLRSNFESDQAINFTRVFLQQNHIENLKEEVTTQEEVREKADKKNETQREKLVESMKDKKIIEKDHENKKKLWQNLMNKEEMKFIDEIASTHFNRH